MGPNTHWLLYAAVVIASAFLGVAVGYNLHPQSNQYRNDFEDISSLRICEFSPIDHLRANFNYPR